MSIPTKRLLVAYLYCNRGGVCSVLKQRLRGLLADGWQVDCVFKVDNDGRDELLQAGVQSVEIYNELFVEETLQAVISGDYDCVTVFDVPELVRSVRAVTTQPLIYEIHTSLPANLNKNCQDTLSSCDAVFVPSKWSERWIRSTFPQLPHGHILVMPDIVDETMFSKEGDRATGLGPMILWVGKLDTFKNWQEAMEIAVAFLGTHQEWRFTMVTGGGYAESAVKDLLQRVARADISERFRWIHNLEFAGLAPLYRGVAVEGGVLLCTSRGESFGLVIHEAMRCGVPVVSTSVGAVPDVVRDGSSGFLYKPGDLQTALSRLDHLARDASMRETLVAGAFDELHRFSGERLRSEYLATLNQIACPASMLREQGIVVNTTAHNGIEYVGSSGFQDSVSRDTIKWDKEWMRYLSMDKKDYHFYFYDMDTPDYALSHTPHQIAKFGKKEMYYAKLFRNISSGIWVPGSEVVGRKVVEMGCGPGAFGRIAGRVCSRYVGIDISQFALYIARLTSPENCQYVHLSDTSAFREISRTMDISVSRHFFIHHNYEDSLWILCFLKDLVKRGGVLYADFFHNPETIDGIRRRCAADPLNEDHPSTLFHFGHDDISRLAADSQLELMDIDIVPEIERQFATFKVP